GVGRNHRLGGISDNPDGKRGHCKAPSASAGPSHKQSTSGDKTVCSNRGCKMPCGGYRSVLPAWCGSSCCGRSAVVVGRSFNQKSYAAGNCPGEQRIRLQTLKTKTDTVLRTLKKQGQTVPAKVSNLRSDTVPAESDGHGHSQKGNGASH